MDNVQKVDNFIMAFYYFSYVYRKIEVPANAR